VSAVYPKSCYIAVDLLSSAIRRGCAIDQSYAMKLSQIWRSIYCGRSRILAKYLLHKTLFIIFVVSGRMNLIVCCARRAFTIGVMRRDDLRDALSMFRARLWNHCKRRANVMITSHRQGLM